MGSCRSTRSVVVLGISLWAVGAWGQTAPDPVEALRAALRMRVSDPNNDEELRYRRANLENRLKALRPADLGPALRLDGWRDRNPDDGVAEVDRTVRDALIQRFSKLMRDTLAAEDATDKRAAIVQIGEMGLQLRASKGRGGLASAFTRDLVAATKDKDAGVRQAAARTLGKVNPPPGEAAGALAALFAAEDVGLRRAAADGLVNLLATLLPAIKSGSGNGADITLADLIEAATHVVPVAGKGAADTDERVVRSSLEAIRLGGTILEVAVVNPSYGEQADLDDMLAPDRKLSAARRRQIDDHMQTIEKERARLLPLVRTLATQVPALVPNLKGEDVDTLIAACAALEALPPGGRLLQRKAAQLAPFTKTKQAPEDPLGAALQKAVSELAALISHKEVRVRLAALYALEEFQGAAVPAAAALAKGLQDTDPFVRWAAARTVGRMAPGEPGKVVPGLARALEDEDGDVRATAAAALERYGPAAKDAVPALGKAALRGEPEMRILAIRALAATGAEAKPAVPDLAKALTAPEAEVRYEAAHALARLGPLARPAMDALRQALEDSDGEVRRAAAEAILGAR